MAGHSRRFNSAGYEGPKWLLPVGERPMIEHVVNMFNPNDSYHFVVSEDQAEHYSAEVNWLGTLASNVDVCVVAAHEKGPTYSALQVSGIPDDAPVIVTYCDFIVQWDYDSFVRHGHGADGAIVSFRGFHPASFGTTLYAYMRTDGDRLLELREKQSFTNNRADEPASAGIYYFAEHATFRHYAQDLLAAEKKELPEAYVSLLFNPMVADGRIVILHDVDAFICLGTPEDYEQYQFWYRYFSDKQTVEKLEERAVKRINLVPMAGSGSRFREYGYRVPKPLIQVRGEPMVLRAMRSMPAADNWIFLPRAKDMERHPIERAIRSLQPNTKFIPVTGLTSGQAATCLLAENVLEADAELLIASCDYEHRFDPFAWRKMQDDPSIDGAVWAHRLGATPTKSADSFAYCRTAKDERTIVEIVEKETISDRPEDDLMVVGTFWYRRAGDFVRGARAMIDNGITVNNEHYVGTSINQLIADGARFVAFEIDQWISFGDPFELEILEYWDSYFAL